MRLVLNGRVDEVLDGARLIADDLGVALAGDGAGEGEGGVRVRVERSDRPVEVIVDGNEATIRYREKVHFYRALGLLVEALREGAGARIVEEPQFDTLGAMIDASRNGVPSVEGARFLIRKLALMGFNMLMLYTEDTYEIPGLPYFGYFRGRYPVRLLGLLSSRCRVLRGVHRTAPEVRVRPGLRRRGVDLVRRLPPAKEGGRGDERRARRVQAAGHPRGVREKKCPEARPTRPSGSFGRTSWSASSTSTPKE